MMASLGAGMLLPPAMAAAAAAAMGGGGGMLPFGLPTAFMQQQQQQYPGGESQNEMALNFAAPPLPTLPHACSVACDVFASKLLIANQYLLQLTLRLLAPFLHPFALPILLQTWLALERRSLGSSISSSSGSSNSARSSSSGVAGVIYGQSGWQLAWILTSRCPCRFPAASGTHPDHQDSLEAAAGRRRWMAPCRRLTTTGAVAVPRFMSGVVGRHLVSGLIEEEGGKSLTTGEVGGLRRGDMAEMMAPLRRTLGVEEVGMTIGGRRRRLGIADRCRLSGTADRHRRT